MFETHGKLSTGLILLIVAGILLGGLGGWFLKSLDVADDSLVANLRDCKKEVSFWKGEYVDNESQIGRLRDVYGGMCDSYKNRVAKWKRCWDSNYCRTCLGHNAGDVELCYGLTEEVGKWK